MPSQNKKVNNNVTSEQLVKAINAVKSGMTGLYRQQVLQYS